jgi:lipoprotein-anchoring transpeptidase ErfK/SrfK
MTTLQAPRAERSARAGASRRHRLAATAASLLFVAAAVSIWQLALSAGTADPTADPPAPTASPPVAADDDPEPLPDLPPPADHWSDEAVVPPLRGPAEAPTEPVEPEDPAEDPTDTPAEDAVEEPEPGEPEPSAAPTPDPVGLTSAQARLQELGYLLGAVDGVEGPQTTAAVMAFQRVNGLSVDGVVGPITLAALASPGSPELRGGPATRIEVDLTRQLAHVLRDGHRIVTLQISSGNGEVYPSATGGTAYARTPVGEFEVERRIHGVRESRLGIMYDPLYFHHGYAIHGSNSVPPYPASHGCIRVTRADGTWLIDNIADGTPVHLYGGTHVFTP